MAAAKPTINLLANAKAMLHSVRQQTDRVLCFYSGGKDSLVLLDLAAPLFTEVICVFMYYVPGLAHVERYMSFAKVKYPNVTVLQVPHFTLSVIQKHGVYCKADPQQKLRKLADVDTDARTQTGLTHSLYGMKKADSLPRRIWLNDVEARHPQRLCIEEKTGKAYPLAGWTQKDVLRYIDHHRLPKTISYGDKASSGIGFNEDCYVYLRAHFPDDLRKMLRVYPASEEILFNYDERIKHQAQPVPEV